MRGEIVVDFGAVGVAPDDGHWQPTEQSASVILPTPDPEPAKPVRSYGFLAERPDAEQMPGQWFIATDEPLACFSVGDAWIEFEGRHG